MAIKFDLSNIRNLYPNLKNTSRNFQKLEKNIKLNLSRYNLNKVKNFSFREFGKIIFPFYSMGNIKSFELLSANELIIFCLYYSKILNYKTVGDFGANLGLHSIILDRCGFKVKAFEPDPVIFQRLKKNIKLNKCKKIKIFNLAVYNKSGFVNFTRVKQNVTASHISVDKDSYGNKDFFKVRAINVKKLLMNLI